MNSDLDYRTKQLLWAKEHTDCIDDKRGMIKAYDNKIKQLDEAIEFASSIQGHCIRTMFKRGK